MSHTNFIKRRAQIAEALRYGRSRAPLAHVAPDDAWPGMWRIVWPDGRRSDLVNLDRAKDAAQAIAERGPPARDRGLFHWEKDHSKTPSGAHPCAQIPPRGLGVAA